MIKFIYVTEEINNEMKPIGFSFFNTVSDTFENLNNREVFFSKFDVLTNCEDEKQAARLTALIPFEWDKNKFVQQN